MEVENHGEVTVRLVSRRWVITDAAGKVEVVEGPGVVGEQPTLQPGEAFRYVSGCPLDVSSGVMEGRYEMQAEGETFWIDVPPFSLDLPGERRTVN